MLLEFQRIYISLINPENFTINNSLYVAILANGII